MRIAHGKCQPTIKTVLTFGAAGGHTTDDVLPDGSLGMRPRVVINAAGLSQAHREQLLAHEMVHARWACAEAQGAARPHVGVEEVEAYWKGGSCDAGGYHRQPEQSKCVCVERHAVESCRMAGLSDEECRRMVRRAMSDVGC